MKKKIIAVVAVVLILAIAVVGTYAYLTDSKSVKNTFTVGEVKISLDEKVTEDTGSGVPVSPEVRNADGNMYRLIPGKTYTKDPQVHILVPSEECYVFVEINNEIADLIDGTMAAQLANNGWTPIDTGSNVYAYSTKVSAPTDPVTINVFESFTVKGDVTGTQLAAVEDDTDITVTAYAVQAYGFDTAKDAWDYTFGAPDPAPPIASSEPEPNPEP